ncbi:MAG: T9SS type A sorting domain-containing protein [Flavobacteriales bacterium]|nr:T9SS type A sorting domain-containing protein [Flavobacteriales bacterium]
MKRSYTKSIWIFTLIMAFSLSSNGQFTQLQRIIGGSGNDRSYSAAQTKEGGYILTGYTSSYGAGGNDVYLVRTDGLGKVLWSKAYGTKDDETGWKVKQTRDSGYVVGGTSNANKGDGLLFKTNASGVVQWSLSFNSDSLQEIYNVLESRFNGDIYVTGVVKSDSLNNNAFLVKFSSAGNFIWGRQIGAAGDEEGFALVEDAKGVVTVVGMLTDDTITTGGKFGVPGDIDYFLASFTPNGNLKWCKNYGTSSEDQIWDIKIHKNNFIVCGWNESGPGMTDVLLSIIDTTGKLKGSYKYTIGNSARAFSINVNPDDTYSLTGYTQSDSFGRQVFYLQTNEQGVILNINSFGGNVTDGHWPSEINRTIDGGFSLFSSSNSFKPSNSYDLYFIRTNDKGNSGCNQKIPVNSNFGISLDENYFGKVTSSNIFAKNTLTTTNITSLFDSMLCCKLEARVAGTSVRVCEGESVRIGKPEIPGYIYKWTQIGGTFTSTEASPLIKPTGTQSYKLVVRSSDGKCAPDSATVTLYIRPDLKDRNFIRDTFFCFGKTVEVTARSGMINYEWKGTKGTYKGQTIVFSAADTVILTVTDTTTCLYMDTMIIERKALPVFNLGNDTTICDNTKITMTGPSGMQSYNWNGGQATTQSFTTNEEKSHTLTVVNPFGCTYSDTRVLFINPSSTFSLGKDTSICEGIDYTIIGPGFLTNYFWNGVSSFNANKVVNKAGTYILEASNSFGCKYTDTIVIGKKTDPVFSLGPDGGVCASGGRRLNGPSAMEYLWSDASTDSTLDVFFAGTYWLRVTGVNGCIYTDTIKLVIVPNPVPELGNDTTICETDSIFLDAGNYVKFSWNSGEKTRIIKVKKAGLYEVTVTDANGCNGIDDKSIKTKFCFSSVRNISIPGLKVYPNPALDKLNVEWLEKYDDAHLSIYDALGQKVYDQKCEQGMNTFSVDVSGFSRGLYFLKVTTRESQQSMRVVLE